MTPRLLLRRIGEAARTHRKRLGCSQEAFADQIGMHRTYYGAIERGEKSLQIVTLLRVTKGLGVQLTTLLAEATGAKP